MNIKIDIGVCTAERNNAKQCMKHEAYSYDYNLGRTGFVSSAAK